MDIITPRPRAAWVAGTPEDGCGEHVVTHPYDGTEVATIALPGPEQVERAVTVACDVSRELRTWSQGAREEVLAQLADGLAARADEAAEVITAETGAPLRWAEVEVRDAVSTFTAADARMVDEARFHETAGGRTLARLVPRGPVLGVVPGHCPLEAAARHVAAGLAVGAPVVLAPTPAAPLSALLLGELLADAGLPDGAFSVLPLSDRTPLGNRLVVPRPCTPGDGVGVVLSDWPDLDDAARRIAEAGTRRAGQPCTAVRRVYVEEGVAEKFVAVLTDAVLAQGTGDPYATDTSVGPLLDEDTARRVVSWVEDAVAGGASLLAGGSRSATTVEPTLLAGGRGDVPSGPVVSVSVVGSAAEAFQSARGTHAGVFTRDLGLAFRASEEVDAAEIVIGDVPSHRPESLSTVLREITTEQLTHL